MRFFTACLAAGIASAKNQSLESALSDLNVLANSEGYKAWEQANFQMIRVLREVD